MASPSLTLLAYDSPILRAYLSVFKELDIKLDNVVVVLFKRLPGQNRNLLSSYFPAPFKNIFLKNSMHNLMNFHPREFKKQYKEVYQIINEALQTRYSFSQEFLSSFDKPINYEEVANSVSYLSIDSYKDPKFIDFINGINKETVFLYSGGGILPSTSFKNPLVKYLHIHPGYLPFVRGADCYLWSHLLDNKIGATSFFMSPGIDEGDILLAEKFEPISINITEKEVIDLKTLYRMVYSYFDPCLRAEVLKSTLKKFNDFWSTEGTPQSNLEGETFYFMNDSLKDLALKRIFK